MNPTSEAPRTISRTSTTVVKMLPTSTTNMTGFRTMWAGASFTNESRIARRTIGGSNRGRLVRAILEEPPTLHEQMLHDRAQRPCRKEGERADDQDHADQQNHEEGCRHRECSGRFRCDPLLGQKAGGCEHGNLHGEPADQGREAEHRVVV